MPQKKDLHNIIQAAKPKRTVEDQDRNANLNLSTLYPHDPFFGVPTPYRGGLTLRGLLRDLNALYNHAMKHGRIDFL